MIFTDLEFQNGAYTLRVAPWLDMALLRQELIKDLRFRLAPDGHMANYVKEFREDASEFCEGKRMRIPRARATISVFANMVSRLFPDSDTDQNRQVAIDHISSRIMQHQGWTRYNRGGAEVEALEEAAKKTDDGFHDDDYDDDDDCGGRGGCGGCDECDRWDDD